MESSGQDKVKSSEEFVSLEKHERDIVFMQSEHDSTIRALHNEVENLGRQCSDLQFKLIFHGILPSKEDALMTQVEELAGKLDKQSLQCQDVECELERQKELVKQLELDLAKQKEKYGQDVGARNLIIVKLRREVQDKNNRIAELLSSLTSRGGPQQASAAMSSTSDTGSNSTYSSSSLGDTGRRLVDKYWRASPLRRATTVSVDEVVVSSRVRE